MKLKPVIEREILKAPGKPLYLKLSEAVRERSTAVMGGAVALLAATVALSAVLIYGRHREDRAAQQYVAARTLEDHLALLKDYPSSSVAALSAFAAAVQFEQKQNWEEAQTYYRLFAEKYPGHFLMPQARFALAFLAERKGAYAEAVGLYRRLLVEPGSEALGLEITRAIERCERKQKTAERDKR